MSNCSKCNKTNNLCGCTDSAIQMPEGFANCPTPCEIDAETCTEVFDMHCVCYQGPGIVELDIQTGDRLDEVMQKLVLAITYPGCVDFADPNACQSPLNVTILKIGSTTLDFTWDIVPIAVSYTVEYKTSTSTTWLINPPIAQPINAATLIGLLPDTIYDLRIKADCATSSCYSLNIRIKTTL